MVPMSASKKSKLHRKPAATYFNDLLSFQNIRPLKFQDTIFILEKKQLQNRSSSSQKNIEKIATLTYRTSRK